MLTMAKIKTGLLLGTWNIQTLYETSRLDHVAYEVKAYKLEILSGMALLQENFEFIHAMRRISPVLVYY